MTLYRDRNLQMVFGVTLMAIVGLSLISPALPKIQDAFGISKTQIGLMVTVFTIPGVVVSPLIGFFSDKRGRKGMVLLSLIVFAVAGGSIAVTRNYTLVLALRFFQGAAASGLSTLSMALIGDAYREQDRADAMGYNASVLSIGAASFPMIGGALASIAWYAPFYFFLLAIPIALAILRFMSIPEQKDDSDYREYLQLAKKELSNIRFAVLIPACIVTFILLYGPYMTYFSLYLDEIFEADPLTIGMILSGMSITTGFVSYKSGYIFSRIGSTKPIYLGLTFYGLSMMVMFSMKNIYMGIPAVFLYGLGQGLNIPILQTKFLNSVSHETRGIVSALFSSCLRLGQSIGPMLMGVFFIIGEYEAVYLLSAVMSFAMAAIVLLSERKNII